MPDSYQIAGDKEAQYVHLVDANGNPIGGVGPSALLKAEDAPHASGDAGILLLGVRNEGLATLADAQSDYTPVGLTRYGGMSVALHPSNVLADGSVSAVLIPLDAAGNGRFIGVHGTLFNGSTHDRARNNVEGTALASAARTATAQSADITNHNGRGLVVVLDVTAFAATPTITPAIDGKDPQSGGYYPILTGAPINVAGASRTVLVVYPGVTETPNVDASFPLPRTFRVTVTHGDADSVTYGVGYTIVL